MDDVSHHPRSLQWTSLDDAHIAMHWDPVLDGPADGIIVQR